MISKDCFTSQWIDEVSTRLEYKDKSLIEKVVRAFSLLEMLVQSGCPLIFKGGTALMLILGKALHRMSIDIDIICPPGTDCICLKKVDSQKESIIMTPHTEFQKKYYQQVIEIHQKTGFSPRKIAKLQLVPVSVRQMYHWIAIFEAENGKGSPRRIMEAKKSKEQEEMESLKSRISELEESLRVERLRNRLNEKIIDIAEARWHIEIRKKAGTKR